MQPRAHPGEHVVGAVAGRLPDRRVASADRTSCTTRRTRRCTSSSSTDHPPPVVHAMITGQVPRVGPRPATSDRSWPMTPSVPPVDEPIWLYLTPAVLAVVIAVGLRLGYPVVRRDRRDRDFAGAAVADGGRVPVRGAAGPAAIDRPSRARGAGSRTAGGPPAARRHRTWTDLPDRGRRDRRPVGRTGRRRTAPSASCGWAGVGARDPGWRSMPRPRTCSAFDERATATGSWRRCAVGRSDVPPDGTSRSHQARHERQWNPIPDHRRMSTRRRPVAAARPGQVR